MKTISLILFCLFSMLHAQNFQQVFSGQSINGVAASGWFYFEKSGDTWKSRLYFSDSLTFSVAAGSFSTNIAYTHTFTPEEKAAGYSIYSLGADLNGDSFSDFYIQAYWGTSTNYRQSFKIFSIVDGTVLFEKNDAATSYSYPTISDLDLDGVLDCMFYKYSYPYDGFYSYEVYSTGVATGNLELAAPQGFTLNQNFPNPFNPSTTIKFSLETPSSVSLDIFNVEGKLIKSLFRQNMAAGEHEVVWDGKDDKGGRIATGVYFYTLKSAGHISTKKMILLK